MAAASRQAGELVARHRTHSNSGGPAESRDSLNASVAAPLRHGYVLEGAPACCQSFFYRVNAEYDLHAAVPMLQEPEQGSKRGWSV
jgi:hypothetical protein